MARTKFQTLTEQMFYILLSLKDECCGMDIMDKVKEMTEGRVLIGPGTLYNLLGQFVHETIIQQHVFKKLSHDKSKNSDIVNHADLIFETINI